MSWSYAVADGEPTSFCRFVVPPQENHNFNTGVLAGGGLNLQQTGAYFFQFGIMSRHPVGHGGWRVELICPSLLTSEWGCVGHAKTIAGGQSFWKVIWRWGEGYPDAAVDVYDYRAIDFGFSPNPAPSFKTLW